MIRNHIINNFKGASINDIKESIVSSYKDEEEITLPGLGVFFSILWEKSNEKEKENILNILKNSF